jgi:hypothetical protein
MKKLSQHEPINLASTKVIQQIDKKTSFCFFLLFQTFYTWYLKKHLNNTIQ